MRALIIAVLVLSLGWVAMRLFGPDVSRPSISRREARMLLALLLGALLVLIAANQRSHKVRAYVCIAISGWTIVGLMSTFVGQSFVDAWRDEFAIVLPFGIIAIGALVALLWPAAPDPRER